MAKGHVRRSGKGSWKLKFELGRDALTGERRVHYSTFKGTKREAEAELTRLMAEADRGSYVAPDKVTVSAFLDRWERDWAAVKVSPKTRQRYVELLRLHVRPHIGALPVQKLTHMQLNELYAKLLREGQGIDKDGNPKGLSPNTVGHVHRVIHNALGRAARWNIIGQNPAALVDRVKPVEREMEILKAEQASDVLHKTKGHPIHPIVALALASGMRRGEILALRWQDVDLDGSKVRVESAVEQTKEGLRVKEPKTKHGRRTIALASWMVGILRDRRRHMQELHLALGAGRLPDDALVFPNIEGGLRVPDTLSAEWRRAGIALGLPRVTFHALRHTHASQLISAGLDVLTISRRMGHGSPAITLTVYGHLFADTDRTAADVIEAAFSGAGTD